jgi:hypothetical protein
MVQLDRGLTSIRPKLGAQPGKRLSVFPKLRAQYTELYLTREEEALSDSSSLKLCWMAVGNCCWATGAGGR